MLCEQCGKDGLDVRLVIDPFSWDVYDEKVEMYLCEQCEQDRADDI